jgi:DNA (cytosine-5)-methyltransferase 1
LRASKGGGDKPFALIAHSLRAEGFDASEDGTGRGTPLVPICFPWQQGGDLSAKSSFPCDTDLSGTLVKNQTHAVVFGCKGSFNDVSVDHAPSLTTGGGGGFGMGMAVAFDTTQITSPLYRSTPAEGKPCHTLAGKAHAPAIYGSAVRRLTPRECERLQGFPDNYTAITYRGKPAADGPRYRALGNSMAVPVMRWIGRRIDRQHSAIMQATAP